MTSPRLLVVFLFAVFMVRAASAEFNLPQWLANWQERNRAHAEVLLLTQGQAAHEAGQREALRDVLRACMWLDLGNPYYALFQCQLELEEGNYARAAAWSEAIIEIWPEEPDAHYLLGVARHNLGHWEDSREAFEAAVALGDTSGSLAIALGWAQLCRGDAEGVLDAAWTARKATDIIAYDKLYTYILEYIGQRMLGHDEAARLAAQKGGAPSQLAIWPRPVLRFLAGEMSAEEMVGHSSDALEETEAWTYAALVRYLDDPADVEARRLFNWVAMHGDPRVFEHGVARAFAERLTADAGEALKEEPSEPASGQPSADQP